MKTHTYLKILLLLSCCLYSMLLLGQQSDYAKDELIIKWKSNYVYKGKANKELKYAKKTETIPQLGIEIWKIKANKIKDIEALAKEYTQRPDIEYAEPNYIYSIAQNPFPSNCTHDDLVLNKGTDDYINSENITYKAANSIIANNIIGAGSNIKYIAEKRVRLKAGFKFNSASGKKFRAYIEDCDGRDDPNDTYIGEQWALDKILAPQAWLIKKESPGVKVAIIDTGIDWRHEDLKDNIWQNLAEDADGDGQIIEWSDSLQQWIFDPGDENGIDDDGNGYIDDFVGWDFANNDNDPYDGHGHGTSVAGVIGAKGDNGIGVAGITSNVELAALKYLDDEGNGRVCRAMEAIRYASMMGMSISNNSWGGESRCNALAAIIDSVGQHGHLFIAAAGNKDINNDEIPYYPASYTADLANVISVAATDRNDHLADFSHYGNSVDIAAPGVDIYTCDKNNTYDQYSGTSLAAPFVAGAAALLMDLHKTKSIEDIRQTIISTADPITFSGDKIINGGRLNLCKALGGCNGTISCSFTDSLALVDLHTTTNGDNWQISWNLDSPISTWHGINTNATGCVTGIHLPHNNLVGNLAASIGNLYFLEQLHLEGNYLSARLPTSIRYLANLKVLNLRNNQLTGSIPYSIGNISTLEELRLDSNSITNAIPNSIGALHQLKILCLNANQLTDKIPAEIAQLTLLDTLLLQDNQLADCLPAVLDTFCVLSTSVDLSNNPDLYGTDFEEFCDNQIGNCEDCKSIDRINLLAVYDSLGGPNWINTWDLSQPISTWHGVLLDEQGECVIGLNLSNNQLSGSIPTEIRGLSNLVTLNLSNNNISGTIPTAIGQLAALEMLDLQHNNIVGQIPTVIGYLPNLTSLSLGHNQLEGLLPQALTNLSKLDILLLNDNQFEGCIPESYQLFCTIGDKDFSNNNLSEGGDFEAFCDDKIGACTDPVWPGDFNADGIVDKTDLLFWGKACGKADGIARTDTSTSWTPQNATDWNSSVENVNTKHQDGNGDGIINDADLVIYERHYGKTHPINVPASQLTDGISYTIERIGARDEGIAYGIRLSDANGQNVSVHGLACTIDLSNLKNNEKEDFSVDFSESSLAPNDSIVKYDENSKKLDIALTRSCEADNKLLEGPVGILIVIADHVAFEDPILKIRKGNKLLSNGDFKAVGSTSYYDKNIGASTATLDQLPVAISVTPEECDKLGSATIQIEGGTSPFTIEWSNEHNENISETINTNNRFKLIPNLLAGAYAFTISDSSVPQKTESYTIEVEGHFIPVFDENGHLVDCNPLDCPPSLDFSNTLPIGTQSAADFITASGTVVAGDTVTLKAGIEILFNPGFNVESNGEILAVIEDCSDLPEQGNYIDVPSARTQAISNYASTYHDSAATLAIRPNPLQSIATIFYELKERSPVRLFITNAQGKYIRTLVEAAYHEAGSHQYPVDANALENGVYFLHLETNNNIETKKMILLD